MCSLAPTSRASLNAQRKAESEALEKSVPTTMFENSRQQVVHGRFTTTTAQRAALATLRRVTPVTERWRVAPRSSSRVWAPMMIMSTSSLRASRRISRCGSPMAVTIWALLSSSSVP